MPGEEWFADIVREAMAEAQQEPSDIEAQLPVYRRPRFVYIGFEPWINTTGREAARPEG